MLLEVLYCISIGFGIYNEYRYIQIIKELAKQSEQISQLTTNINNHSSLENCQYIKGT